MMLLTAIAFLSLFTASSSDVHHFSKPIDALSVTFADPQETGEIRYRQGSVWSDWQELHVENEQDPSLLESNLVLFPKAVTEVELRGLITAMHPIAVSNDPVHYTVAALSDPGSPRILSRSDWGADETLRYKTAGSSSSTTKTTPAESAGDNGGGTSQRVEDCNAAQLNYPNEFKTTGRTTRTEDGNPLLWPHTYSRSVNLIVVHHTAMKVDGDTRSGEERVRALYAYHAENRGWGDIGYHYLVDEDGKIYEGKAGGKFVIGGHAYCNNTGTIGIALLGNFELEQPTQKQLKALQWLIADLGEEYKIDLDESVKFHGKTLPAVVGHRDLLSTDCPGYYLYNALGQVRSHAASGDVDASVKLPKMPASSKSSSSRKNTRITQSSSTGTPRRVSRLLETTASKLLRRKLGSNPGKETEAGVEARRTARLSGSSVSRSKTSVRRSSRSSTSRSSRSSSSARPTVSTDTSTLIRIRLVSRENGATSCSSYDLNALASLYRGSLECLVVDGKAAIINDIDLDDYLLGLAEEPDTEPYEKQRAFAVAARTYAAWYMDPEHRKFPGMPYDGSDSPATFQKYNGRSFEKNNPHWLDAVRDTEGLVLTYNGEIIKPPYFSSDDGRTRTPKEAGWSNFPFAEIFGSKNDPWCEGMPLNGHGVGMSGCGAEGQANDGKTGEEILRYYYPGTVLESM